MNMGHRHKTKEAAEACIAKNSRPGKFKWSESEMREMLRLYESGGATTAAIGTMTGRSQSRISQLLSKARRQRDRAARGQAA